MSEITVRELRNHGGDVIDRAAGGETGTVTAPASRWPNYARR
jgi:antitoxin (DNA-binding transcriptional repressor) of toxin-antitoxin stability system